MGCLVINYIQALKTDPTGASGTDTGYNVFQDSIGRVHVIADETEAAITRTTDIEVVR